MSVDVRNIGDRAKRTRALLGQNYSEAILVSGAISGRIIRVLSLSVDAIGNTSGSVQIAILNSGGSGTETIVYEQLLSLQAGKAVTSAFGLQITPSKALAPISVPVSRIPPLQNGQALVGRTNNTSNSGIISASATYWSDED